MEDPHREELTPPHDVATIREERRALREVVKSRLAAEGENDLLERISACGDDLCLVCNCCGVRKVVQTRCDLKWCPSCQHGLAADAAARYEKIVTLAQWPLRTTFTARNFTYAEARFDREDDNPVRLIRRSFTRMRDLRWWKKKVVGGVAATEITDIGNGYHIHIHGLIDCQWLSVNETQPAWQARKDVWKSKGRKACGEVAEQWSMCCHRPASVNVRRVWKADGGSMGPALADTLKYSVKGSDLATCARPVGPFIRMIDKCRMITSFGSFHGTPEMKKPHRSPPACDGCGALSSMLPEAVIEGEMWRDYNSTRSRRRR